MWDGREGKGEAAPRDRATPGTRGDHLREC